MHTILFIAILAVFQLPVIFLSARAKERKKQPLIHFYGQYSATFGVKELQRAKMFAKHHPYLKLTITDDVEVIFKGVAKEIHQFKLK